MFVCGIYKSVFLLLFFLIFIHLWLLGVNSSSLWLKVAEDMYVFSSAFVENIWNTFCFRFVADGRKVTNEFHIF